MNTIPTVNFKDNEGASDAIDRALGQFAARATSGWLPAPLRFAPEVESAFEKETGTQRARELAIVTAVAMVLSYSLVLADYVFTPYLFVTCLYLRLLPLPAAFFVVVWGAKSSARVRELAITVFAFVVIVVMTVVACLSREPFAQYTFYMPSLCLVCGITGIPLRFGHAWRYFALCSLTVAAELLLYKHPGFALTVATLLVVLAPNLFALVANYRLEKTARTVWLLAAREALRLDRLQQDREDLETVAKTDGLTGLANRGQFDRQLASIIASPSHAGRSLWLIMLDVDFFKRYNDAYGHPAGDSCLRLIAQILAETVTGQDGLAFRYGGEEFGVLLPAADDAVVLQLAETVRCRIQHAALRHANRDDGLNVATASLGIGKIIVRNESTARELIEHADQALYRAKQEGRNRIIAGWNIFADLAELPRELSATHDILKKTRLPRKLSSAATA